MKKLVLTFTFALITILHIFAANTTRTVSQVTEGVTLTDDVDYVISHKTQPFTTAGSVNIENTEHAVVILKYFKPSKVISTYLKYIYINGEAAKNDDNCQVKMYGNGAIIMPYGKDFKPLTVYSEPDFQGDSTDNFNLNSASGFMQTLTAAQLNNKIRSFKLKRGYMVTFALGTGGWGYSRCFIADKEDLEFASMPANMDMKISSYRLFKWNDAKKSGLASDTGYASTQATNASWCYSWGTGENRYPDTECVPNHIYEDWPSPSACGSVTYSCHMKTNNEPGNSSDDKPQDVSTVLANWQNLMRTGLRLCSETSHDGSMSHLAQFCDSIDAYGWRCDIVDLHCYWASGTFNSLTWYSDNYGNGRPIWISEWLWGASWNKNGIFGAVSNWDDFSSATQTTNYNGVKPILDVLNSNERVERYAYWNSERNCSKIYKDGALSKLGEYYASMEPGIGYKKSQEFIPKVVFKTPYGLQSTYSKAKKTVTLTWNDPNGDMVDAVTVECKLPGSNTFTEIASIQLKDQNNKDGVTYTYTDTLSEAGAYYYRATSYPNGAKTPKYTGETSITIGSATGNDIIQYGTLSVTNTETIDTDFETSFSETPYLFMGLPTNKNPKMYPCNLISSVSKTRFTYQFLPWQQSGEQTMTSTETIPFMAICAGNYTFGNMAVEAGSAKVKGDTTEIVFTQAFPEGVVPVVIAETKPTLKTNGIMYRIWDVTNTGFKATLTYEAGLGKAFNVAQTLNYLACTPGQGLVDEDIMISAGKGKDLLYGSIGRSTVFYETKTDGTVSEESDTLLLTSPLVFAALQTYNMPVGAILRKSSDMTQRDKDTDMTLQYGAYIKRCKDGSAETDTRDTKATGDEVGWICISIPSGTTDVSAVFSDRANKDDKLYNLAGQAVDDSFMGIVIKNGRKYLKK